MSKIELRRISRLEYREPTDFLVELRKLEIEVALSPTPDPVRHLRTNGLKSIRELRQAAIFCHMMAERVGTTVYVAPVEAEDYDFVALHHLDGTDHYSKVQLKELPPTNLPGSRTLNSLISTLGKYGKSPNLCVAVYLNQRLNINPLDLELPEEARGIGSLWMFGAIEPDQSRWGLWGNLLEAQRYETSHFYPQ
jgi:hypothetical protein